MNSKELNQIALNSKEIITSKFYRENTIKLLSCLDDLLEETALEGNRAKEITVECMFGEKYTFFKEFPANSTDYWKKLLSPKYNHELARWANNNQIYITVTWQPYTSFGRALFSPFDEAVKTEIRENAGKRSFIMKIDFREHNKLYRVGRKLIGGNSYVYVRLPV